MTGVRKRGGGRIGIWLLLLLLGAACDSGPVREQWAELGSCAQTLLARHEPLPGARPLSASARHARRLLARPIAGRAKLNLVLWLDGMRHDDIDPIQTPNLSRLRREGVSFVNGRSAYRSVGAGRLSWVPSLAERLHAEGEALALVSFSSSGITHHDRDIGLMLDQLVELGLYDVTNILVVASPAYGGDTQRAKVAASLVAAGLKAAPDSDDVVLASNGQAVSILVADRDPETIASIVRHLQSQRWAGVPFTRHDASCDAAPHQGCAEGTFALDLAPVDGAEGGADILLSTSDASESWFAWGVDFKDGIVDPVPASELDIVPTLLALAGANPGELDGRVLTEALEGGPDPAELPMQTRALLAHTEAGYHAELQLTEVADELYIDAARRLRREGPAARAQR